MALQESNQNATVSKTIQDHFNERYLKILDVQQTEHDKVNGLKVGISEIISGIKGLITANNTKSELISSIKQLETLLKTAEDNDKAVTGRKYFGELVASNQEAYDALLIASDGTKKNKLESNILALKNQGISGAVLYAASWAASLIAVTYRYTAPQIVQNSVIALTPETADSACKNGLKDLAKEHLTNLKNQLKATELDITTVTNILSGEHDALKQLLRAESPENLTLLLDANNTTKEALEHYSELSESLQEKRVKLNNIKETHTELDQFIMKNDTFAVKLSNILANISTWFKSDAAEMVDNAKQIKQELFFFEAIYLSAIDKNLSDIKTNPELNEDIKTKLRDAFHPMTTQTPQAGEPGVSTIEEFQAFRMKFQNQIVDSSRHGFFAYEPGADKQQPVYSTIGSCPEFTLR